MIGISIILASKEVPKFCEFLDSLKNTASNPDNIEVIVKIDKRDKNFTDYYKSDKWKEYPFKIKFIITEAPQFGNCGGLELAYNQGVLYSDENTYFITFANEKLKYTFKGWDELILKYKNAFEDDIFCIRTSSFRDKKYSSVQQMILEPDNYRFITKKFFCLMQGVGDHWSPDSWFEVIMQILSTKYLKQRQVVLKETLHDPTTEIINIVDNRKKVRFEAAIKNLVSPIYHEFSYEKIAKEVNDYINSFYKEHDGNVGVKDVVEPSYLLEGEEYAKGKAISIEREKEQQEEARSIKVLEILENIYKLLNKEFGEKEK